MFRKKAEKWKCDELFAMQIKKLIEMENDPNTDETKLEHQRRHVEALLNGDLKFEELHKKPERKRLDPNCIPALLGMAVVAIAPYAVERFAGKIANHMKPRVETPKFWH